MALIDSLKHPHLYNLRQWIDYLLHPKTYRTKYRIIDETSLGTAFFEKFYGIIGLTITCLFAYGIAVAVFVGGVNHPQVLPADLSGISILIGALSYVAVVYTSRRDQVTAAAQAALTRITDADNGQSIIADVTFALGNSCQSDGPHALFSAGQKLSAQASLSTPSGSGVPIKETDGEKLVLDGSGRPIIPRSGKPLKDSMGQTITDERSRPVVYVPIMNDDLRKQFLLSVETQYTAIHGIDRRFGNIGRVLILLPQNGLLSKIQAHQVILQPQPEGRMIATWKVGGKIYDRPLSEIEIKRLYALQLPKNWHVTHTITGKENPALTRAAAQLCTSEGDDFQNVHEDYLAAVAFHVRNFAIHIQHNQRYRSAEQINLTKALAHYLAFRILRNAMIEGLNEYLPDRNSLALHQKVYKGLGQAEKVFRIIHEQIATEILFRDFFRVSRMNYQEFKVWSSEVIARFGVEKRLEDLLYADHVAKLATEIAIADTERLQALGREVLQLRYLSAADRNRATYTQHLDRGRLALGTRYSDETERYKRDMEQQRKSVAAEQRADQHLLSAAESTRSFGQHRVSHPLGQHLMGEARAKLTPPVQPAFFRTFATPDLQAQDIRLQIITAQTRQVSSVSGEQPAVFYSSFFSSPADTPLSETPAVGPSAAASASASPRGLEQAGNAIPSHLPPPPPITPHIFFSVPETPEERARRAIGA